MAKKSPPVESSNEQTVEPCAVFVFHPREGYFSQLNPGTKQEISSKDERVFKVMAKTKAGGVNDVPLMFAHDLKTGKPTKKCQNFLDSKHLQFVPRLFWNRAEIPWDGVKPPTTIRMTFNMRTENAKTDIELCNLISASLPKRDNLYTGMYTGVHHGRDGVYMNVILTIRKATKCVDFDAFDLPFLSWIFSKEIEPFLDESGTFTLTLKKISVYSTLSPRKKKTTTTAQQEPVKQLPETTATEKPTSTPKMKVGTPAVEDIMIPRANPIFHPPVTVKETCVKTDTPTEKTAADAAPTSTMLPIYTGNQNILVFAYLLDNNRGCYVHVADYLNHTLLGRDVPNVTIATTPNGYQLVPVVDPIPLAKEEPKPAADPTTATVANAALHYVENEEQLKQLLRNSRVNNTPAPEAESRPKHCTDEKRKNCVLTACPHYPKTTQAPDLSQLPLQYPPHLQQYIHQQTMFNQPWFGQYPYPYSMMPYGITPPLSNPYRHAFVDPRDSVGVRTTTHVDEPVAMPPSSELFLLHSARSNTWATRIQDSNMFTILHHTDKSKFINQTSVVGKCDSTDFVFDIAHTGTFEFMISFPVDIHIHRNVNQFQCNIELCVDTDEKVTGELANFLHKALQEEKKDDTLTVLCRKSSSSSALYIEYTTTQLRIHSNRIRYVIDVDVLKCLNHPEAQRILKKTMDVTIRVNSLLLSSSVSPTPTVPVEKVAKSDGMFQLRFTKNECLVTVAGKTTSCVNFTDLHPLSCTPTYMSPDTVFTIACMHSQGMIRPYDINGMLPVIVFKHLDRKYWSNIKILCTVSDVSLSLNPVLASEEVPIGFPDMKDYGTSLVANPQWGLVLSNLCRKAFNEGYIYSRQNGIKNYNFLVENLRFTAIKFVV